MEDKELFLQQLKETISEGRALLKDLKQERKEIKAVLENVKKEYEKELVRHVSTELEVLSNKTQETCELVERKIWHRFERMEKLIFEGPGKNRGPSLETMLMNKLKRNDSV